MNKVGEPTVSKLASMLYRETQRYLARRFSRYDLGSGTYPILLSLDCREGISQSELSAEIGVDKALIARGVKRLMESGYVERQTDGSDSRVNRLYLTAKGKEIVPELRSALARWNRGITEGIPAEELGRALETLAAVAKNAKRGMDDGRFGDCSGEER